MHASSIRYIDHRPTSHMNGFQDRIRNSIRTTERVICSNPNGTAFIGVENRSSKGRPMIPSPPPPSPSAPPPLAETSSIEPRRDFPNRSPQIGDRAEHRTSPPLPPSGLDPTVSVHTPPASESGPLPWYQKVPKWVWWGLGILFVIMIVWSWTSNVSSSRTEQFQASVPTPTPESTEEVKDDSSESISLPYDKVWDDWSPTVKKNNS